MTTPHEELIKYQRGCGFKLDDVYATAMPISGLAPVVTTVGISGLDAATSFLNNIQIPLYNAGYTNVSNVILDNDSVANYIGAINA